MADLDTLKQQYASPVGILDGGKPQPPTAAEMQHETVAPGEPALLPLGVVYQAFWQDPADGMARHARAQVRALAASGLPVALHGIDVQGKYFFDQDIDPAAAAEVAHLRTVSFHETALAIRQIVLSTPRHLEWTVCPGGARLSSFADQKAVYAATILYTSWERSTVPKPLADILKRCGAVWVPCHANAAAFREAGIEAEVIPFPFDPNGFVSYPAEVGKGLVQLGAPISPAAHIPAPRGSEHVPDGRRFYSIGKWEPRKGLHELIGAFLMAFSPKDRVSLDVKTWDWRPWDKYPTPAESLSMWSEHAEVRSKWTVQQIDRRVRIVSEKISAEKLNDLHRKNNIYVSASHGEAWDLPAFDAVSAGNSLVHVGYGGTDDYAYTCENVRVTHAFGPVHPGYGWEEEAQWAEYRMEDLVEALRAAKPPSKRVLPPALYRDFGVHAVGERMKASVLRVAARIGRGMETRLAQAGAFG